MTVHTKLMTSSEEATRGSTTGVLILVATGKDIIPVADQQYSFKQSKYYKSMLNFGRSGNKTEEYELWTDYL